MPQIELDDDDRDFCGYDDDDDGSCFICGGEGVLEGSEFSDPMWYDENEFYKCYSCRGSGARKDMTVM